MVNISYAVLAELADAHGSGPCEATHGGSNPLDRTIIFQKPLKISRKLVKSTVFCLPGFIRMYQFASKYVAYKNRKNKK